METLVVTLASSIATASVSGGSSSSNRADVHKMALSCAQVDAVTIIGSSKPLTQGCARLDVALGGSFCAGRMASLLLQVVPVLHTVDT